MPKDTVGDTNKFDSSWLIRDGNLVKGEYNAYNKIIWTRSGIWGRKKNDISYDFDFSNVINPRMRIYYSISNSSSNESSDVDYWINLTSTDCNFGGRRYWFTCPNNNCQRRIGTLYLGRKYFLCRHCLDLTYESRNTSKRFRSWEKLFNLEEKIDKYSETIYGKFGRKFYNGAPTKRFKKYLSLIKSSINSSKILIEFTK